MYRLIYSKRTDVTVYYTVDADSPEEAREMVESGKVKSSNEKLLDMDKEFIDIEEW